MAAHEAINATGGAALIPEDSFALRLVIIRKALGLTQMEAAERCGLDDGSWSNWESGAKPRGMDKVVGTIASKLAIDREWLMWGGPLGQNRKKMNASDLQVIDGGDEGGQGRIAHLHLVPTP